MYFWVETMYSNNITFLDEKRLNIVGHWNLPPFVSEKEPVMRKVKERLA